MYVFERIVVKNELKLPSVSHTILELRNIVISRLSGIIRVVKPDTQIQDVYKRQPCIHHPTEKREKLLDGVQR